MHVCLQPNRRQAGTRVLKQAAEACCWSQDTYSGRFLLMHRVSVYAYFSPFIYCWTFPGSNAVFFIINPSPTCVASPACLWKQISLSNLPLTVVYFSVQCVTDYSDSVVPVQWPSLKDVFKKEGRERGNQTLILPVFWRNHWTAKAMSLKAKWLLRLWNSHMLA